MALIRSALEIAMERTQGLEADTAALQAVERRRDGKRLAAEFLADPVSVDLKARIEAQPKDVRQRLREGAFDTLATRIQLPATKTLEVEAEFAILARGFAALANAPFADKRVQGLFQQLSAFLKQFLDDAEQLDKGLRRQFEPRLKQREQEAAARTGRAVRLDPMSDPEFVKVYQQQAGKLKAQYQQALDQAKQDLASQLGIERG